MKRRSIVAFVAALVMGMVIALPTAFAGGATRTTVDSVSPEIEGLTGTSTLVRNDNGVSMTFHVVGLTPGNAYSVWFSINGFPPPAAFADGGVAGGTGKATFAGHLAEDGLLNDTSSDEVFLVVLDHGPKVPGSIREQMTDPFTCDGPCPPVLHAIHSAP